MSFLSSMTEFELFCKEEWANIPTSRYAQLVETWSKYCKCRK